jgi:nitroreductase
MMDAYEVLYTTRAMRRLKPDPVPDEAIARIVDAGIRAPATGVPMKQAWRFVTVTDRATMTELAKVWRARREAILQANPGFYANPKQASSAQYLAEHFHETPLLILGYGPEGIGAFTVVQACWSMCLAARAQKLGSTYTMLLAQAQPEVDRILGVPADAAVKLYAALPIGWPLGRWGIAPRQPAHEVTFAERWGQAPAWKADPPKFAE